MTLECGVSTGSEIIQQINENTIDINNLSNLKYKGSFTPSESEEYPLNPENGSWYVIDGLPDTGYTYQTGDLAGKTANNNDSLVFDGSIWFLLVAVSKDYVDNQIETREPSLGLGTAGQILATNPAQDDKIWIDVPISLPDATGKAQHELSTDGSAEDAAYWSPFRMTPKSINSSYTIPAGANASIGSFVLEDGNTITVEDGARMTVI